MITFIEFHTFATLFVSETNLANKVAIIEFEIHLVVVVVFNQMR